MLLVLWTYKAFNTKYNTKGYTLSRTILVCGSRHFNDYNKMKEILDGINFSTLIHGGANGADTLSGMYARNYGKEVHCYPALWELHGKRAGPIRNGQMLREGKPDLVIAFL